MRMTKLFVAGTLFAILAPLYALACSSSDDSQAGDTGDASADDAISSDDADPCNAYTGVGKACSLAAGKICFPQCTSGGCFCQGGVWACRTDFSCYADGSPLDDAFPNDDVNVPDASTEEDAADAADANDDVRDAGDASDAPSDADDAG